MKTPTRSGVPPHSSMGLSPLMSTSEGDKMRHWMICLMAVVMMYAVNTRTGEKRIVAGPFPTYADCMKVLPMPQNPWIYSCEST